MEQYFNQLFNQYNGKYCEKEDPIALNQCMDLMFAWVDMLDIPRDIVRRPSAGMMTSIGTSPYFTHILNTPDGVPQKGDIVIFGTSPILPYGHVCIATGNGNTDWFESFDQNWPLETPCHIQRHDYNGVSGWLRPTLKPAVTMVEVPNDEYPKLITKATNADTFFNHYGFNPLDTQTGVKAVLYVDDLKNQIQTLQARNSNPMPQQLTIDELTKQLADKQQTIIDLNTKINNDVTSINDLMKEEQSLQEQIADFKVSQEKQTTMLQSIITFISKFIKIT